MEDRLKIECHFVGEAGEVVGVKSYDATEAPNNQVISFASLASVVELDFVELDGALDENGFIMKCRDAILESDDDLVDAVVSAVKFGTKPIVVEVFRNNDWELIDEWSRKSDSGSVSGSVNNSCKEMSCSDKTDGEQGGDDDEKQSSGDRENQDVIKEADRKVEGDEGSMNYSEEIVLETETTAENENSGENSESLDEGREHARDGSELVPPVIGKPDTLKEVSVFGQALLEKQQKNMEQCGQVFETSTALEEINSSVEDHKSMATLGCFQDNVSEWTRPSLTSKDSQTEDVRSFHDESVAEIPPDTSSVRAKSSSVGDISNGPSSDFLSAALNDIEMLLGRDQTEENMKLKDLLKSFSTVVSEVLDTCNIRTNDPESVSDSGNESEDVVGLVSRLLCIAKDRDVVMAIQKFVASTAVSDLVVDIATNEACTPECLRNIILNHLGDLLPEVGRVFRQTPQVLVLVPQLLVWLVAQLKLKQSDSQSTDGGHSNATQNTSSVVHHNILCDGCEASPERRIAAIQNGTICGQYIQGVRYKSAITSDYDLCETCELSGEFDEQYAPFLKIKTPEKAPAEIVCILRNNENSSSSGNQSERQAEPIEVQPEIPPGQNGANTSEPERRVSLLVCPSQGHPLQRFGVPNRLFACDLCDRRPSVGSTMYGCRACDWDMCQTCAENNFPGDVCQQREVIPSTREVISSTTEVIPSTREVISSTREVPFRPRPPAPATPVVINYEDPKFRPRSKFISDVSMPDGCVVKAGSKFTKIWRVKNTSESNISWPNQCRIVCVGGDMMGCNPGGVLVPPVPAGEVGDICVNLTAPSVPGRYVGYWRLITPSTSANPGGVRFGQRLWIDLAVATADEPQETASVPPVVTQTPGTNNHQERLCKWSQQLQQLSEMDFLDCEKNVELLEEEEGNMTRVVERLLLD